MYDYKAPNIPTNPIYSPLEVKDFELPKPVNMLPPYKDKKGRVIEGSIYYVDERVSVSPFNYSYATGRTRLNKATSRIKATHSNAASDASKALAIMAVPLKYVANNLGFSEIAKQLGNNFNERFRILDYAYAYIMVTDDNDTSGVDYSSQSAGWSFYNPRSFYPKDSSDIPEYSPDPTILNGNSNITGEYLTQNIFAGNTFIKDLINEVDIQKVNAGVAGIEENVIEVLQTALDGGYYNGLQMYYIQSENATSYNHIAAIYNRYSTSIAATIPIFGYDDYEKMKDYFATGNTEGAMNQDYIDLSDVNLATDWVVYVRGTRYPDIWVTMKSDGLDEFLSDSTKNTTGLSKYDVKCQWRYPVYLPAPPPAFLPIPYEAYMLYLNNTAYNETYPTSWKELFSLNYGRFNSWEYGGEPGAKLVDTAVEAELEMRIVINDVNFSSWVRMKGKYIGSPSVETFVPYTGIVQGVNDGSTITFIYDEFPPDYPTYKDPDGNTDVGDTSPSEDGGLALNKLTTSYQVSDENLQRLGAFLWSASFWDNIKLMNNSPIENIVGCKIMPLLITGTPEDIVVGNVNTAVSGDVITTVPNVTVGEIEYNGYYNSFLDYSPYTEISIFLPFIGFIPLDPAQVTGHKLKVIYSFDVILGQCKAMLFVDDIYFLSSDGTCGIDIPLVASNRAQVEAGMAASVLSATVGAIETGGASLPQNVAGVLSDYTHMQYHYQRSGQYSPTLGWIETRNCYLCIALPVVDYPSTYGHDFGYPCNLSFGLATLKGFTQTAPDVDLSGIPCTEEEREMIRSALVGGVYL